MAMSARVLNPSLRVWNALLASTVRHFLHRQAPLQRPHLVGSLPSQTVLPPAVPHVSQATLVVLDKTDVPSVTLALDPLKTPPSVPTATPAPPMETT